MHMLYHLIQDKRHRDGFRKVNLLNGEFDELAAYVDSAKYGAGQDWIIQDREGGLN